MEQNSPTTSDLREELRSDTERVTSAATERLETEADSRKGEAAGQARKLSSALDSAARELGPDGPYWIRSALEQGARAIEQLAQTVEHKDSRQLAGDVQRLAREHPGSFLTGSFLVGFAAARVLKAGGSGGAQASATGTQAYSPNEPYEPYEPYSSEALAETQPMMPFSDDDGTAVSVTPQSEGRPL